MTESSLAPVQAQVALVINHLKNLIFCLLESRIKKATLMIFK